VQTQVVSTSLWTLIFPWRDLTRTVADAGGPGGTCGICYQLTPVSSAGTVLSSQALTFMVIDECPAAEALSGGYNCDQCNISEDNVLGRHWNFDIAVDAMSTSQVRLLKIIVFFKASKINYHTVY
jgi:hypothetical protein